MIAYGLGIDQSFNLAFNLADEEDGGNIPVDAITTDSGIPIVTDDGQYIIIG